MITTQKVLVRDPSDAKQVRKGEDLERFLMAREKADLRWMLSQERGRRFLSMFLGNCGVFEVPYDKDALEMARKCGKQAVGKWLQEKLLGADPLAYLKLYEESIQDKLTSQDEEKKESESDGGTSND